MVKFIQAKTLKQWLDAQEAVLVDVREPEEFAEERIPGSILQPLAKVSLNNLPDITNKKLVMHCKGGVRSEFACEKLLAENPKLEVYNLEGGILAWKQHGLRIHSSPHES